jgi:hypothetical protein
MQPLIQEDQIISSISFAQSIRELKWKESLILEKGNTNGLH